MQKMFVWSVFNSISWPFLQMRLNLSWCDDKGRMGGTMASRLLTFDDILQLGTHFQFSCLPALVAMSQDPLHTTFRILRENHIYMSLIIFWHNLCKRTYSNTSISHESDSSWSCAVLPWLVPGPWWLQLRNAKLFEPKVRREQRDHGESQAIQTDDPRVAICGIWNGTCCKQCSFAAGGNHSPSVKEVCYLCLGWFRTSCTGYRHHGKISMSYQNSRKLQAWCQVKFGQIIHCPSDFAHFGAHQSKSDLCIGFSLFAFRIDLCHQHFFRLAKSSTAGSSTCLGFPWYGWPSGSGNRDDFVDYGQTVGVSSCSTGSLRGIKIPWVVQIRNF